jgi:hypothetical protein
MMMGFDPINGVAHAEVLLSMEISQVMQKMLTRRKVNDYTEVEISTPANEAKTKRPTPPHL